MLPGEDHRVVGRGRRRSRARARGRPRTAPCRPGSASRRRGARSRSARAAASTVSFTARRAGADAPWSRFAYVMRPPPTSGTVLSAPTISRPAACGWLTPGRARGVTRRARATSRGVRAEIRSGRSSRTVMAGSQSIGAAGTADPGTDRRGDAREARACRTRRAQPGPHPGHPTAVGGLPASKPGLCAGTHDLAGQTVAGGARRASAPRDPNSCLAAARHICGRSFDRRVRRVGLDHGPTNESHVTGTTVRSSSVARAGIEPATFRFSGGRSYRLSYLASETGRTHSWIRPAQRPRRDLNPRPPP